MEFLSLLNLPWKTFLNKSLTSSLEIQRPKLKTEHWKSWATDKYFGFQLFPDEKYTATPYRVITG